MNKTACDKALGVHRSYIIEGRLLKKVRYIIIGTITLSINKSDDV